MSSVQIFLGPRGGKLYINKAGKKVYGTPSAPTSSSGHAQVSASHTAERPGIPHAEQVRIGREFLDKHEAGLAAETAILESLAGGGAKISARAKALESALEKLVRKPSYRTVADLQDGSGFRIIHRDLAGVQQTVAAIKARYKVVAEDDYIHHPKEGSGYRSHHIIIVGHDGLQKEIQIRTENEHTFAEWAHHIYKPGAAKAEVEKEASAVQKYQEFVSNLFFVRDGGKAPIERVPCPPVIKKYFGCMS
jgi:hypothetical protein